MLTHPHIMVGMPRLFMLIFARFLLVGVKSFSSQVISSALFAMSGVAIRLTAPARLLMKNIITGQDLHRAKQSLKKQRKSPLHDHLIYINMLTSYISIIAGALLFVLISLRAQDPQLTTNVLLSLVLQLVFQLIADACAMNAEIVGLGRRFKVSWSHLPSTIVYLKFAAAYCYVCASFSLSSFYLLSVNGR